MKRKKKKEFKVDLIITADWHLMEKERNPPCRTDSHWEAQWDKVYQILSLQDTYECPIFHAGDLFEHWKTSPHLLNTCLRTFPVGAIYTIIGNHDMPQHNVELMEKSGLWTLIQSEVVEYIRNQMDWNREILMEPMDILMEPMDIKSKKVSLIHIMTYKGKSPWPGCSDPNVSEVMDTFPDADLIITGHNHKTFTHKRGKQLLINPGSLTRHKADQIDHKPCVFLWNAETNTAKPHYLKIKKNVISRDHIDIKNKKNERNVAFIKKLKQGYEAGFSFEDNLEQVFQENKIHKKIKQLIYKWGDLVI